MSVDSHVSNLAFNVDDDYTVVAWVSVLSFDGIIFQISDDHGKTSFTLSITPSGYPRAEIKDDENITSVTQEEVLSTGETWHQLVGVYTGHPTDPYVDLYVDGFYEGQSTGSMSPFSVTSFKRAKIGRTAGVIAQSHFDGQIDEVRVFKRALDPDHIELLYKRPSGRPPVIMWGTITNLNTGAGNFITFTAVDVHSLHLDPLSNKLLPGPKNSNEKILIGPVYWGKLTSTNIWGVFFSNISKF